MERQRTALRDEGRFARGVSELRNEMGRGGRRAYLDCGARDEIRQSYVEFRGKQSILARDELARREACMVGLISRRAAQ